MLSTVETVTSKKRLPAVKILEGFFEYHIAISRMLSLETGLFYVVGSVVILRITQPEKRLQFSLLYTVCICRYFKLNSGILSMF